MSTSGLPGAAAGVGVKVDEAVGGSLTVDEESVEPEVEELALGHVPRPAENVKLHVLYICLPPFKYFCPHLNIFAPKEVCS